MAQQEELERRAEELSSVAYKPLVIILVDFSHRNQFVSWIIPEMLLMKLWFIEQWKGLKFINKFLLHASFYYRIERNANALNLGPNFSFV